MLEQNLSRLEQLVEALVEENKALLQANAQLNGELARLREENDSLQLSALEQEELQGSTAARIRALVELASRGGDGDAGAARP